MWSPVQARCPRYVQVCLRPVAVSVLMRQNAQICTVSHRNTPDVVTAPDEDTSILLSEGCFWMSAGMKNGAGPKFGGLSSSSSMPRGPK